MTPEQATHVIKRLASIGQNARLHPDYSGRDMFGSTTHAVSAHVPPTTFRKLCADLGDFRSDNLGRGWIYY